MRKLYIIGARGCGRETYSRFQLCKQSLKDVECCGFLDDNIHALDGFDGYPPIVSSVEDFMPKENDVFICALGDPRWVKHYTSIIEAKGGKFLTLICPGAYISKNVKIGDGCIISGWTVISNDVTIGNHCYIGVFSDLGHDVSIGDCCHLGSYTFMGGGARLADCVTVHPRVNILPRKTIGQDAILGAGSVVVRNVQQGITVFGNPARAIN